MKQKKRMSKEEGRKRRSKAIRGLPSTPAHLPSASWSSLNWNVFLNLSGALVTDGAEHTRGEGFIIHILNPQILWDPQKGTWNCLWLLFFSFLSFFFFFFCHTHSIWKCAGGESNPSYSCNLRHTSGNARSITPWAGLGMDPTPPQRQH